MGTCNQVVLSIINMRVLILLLVVFLAVAVVHGQKGKGKGKGKPSKPEGSGKPSKGKGKGKGKGKPTKPEGGSSVEGSGEGPGEGLVPEPRPGFCVSPEEMYMICTAESAFAEKGPGAMETCAEYFETGPGEGTEEKPSKPSKGKGKGKGKKPKGRGLDVLLDMRAKKPKGKGKGKGKGSKPTSCPESAEIIAMAAEKYAGEICMFTAMGWLDNDMVADDNMIEADLMTLPNEISDALTGDDFAQCVADFESSAMGFGQKCVKTYTEEDAAVLTAVLNGVARTECFKTMMDHSCGLYMSNTMAAMAGLGNTGSGSEN